jgi:hypothetical protein
VILATLVTTVTKVPTVTLVTGNKSNDDYVKEKFHIHILGIELATFRLVEHCLNQLRHRAIIRLVTGKIHTHWALKYQSKWSKNRDYG